MAKFEIQAITEDGTLCSLSGSLTARVGEAEVSVSEVLAVFTIGEGPIPSITMYVDGNLMYDGKGDGFAEWLDGYLNQLPGWEKNG